MTQTDSRSPVWHPDEIAFLRKHGVLHSTDDASNVTRVKERWVYSTLREVFLTANGFVLKRYSHFPGRKDYRRVWLREHDALNRVEDLNTPNSKGYINVTHSAEVTGTLHLRTLLPGSVVNWNCDNTLESLAELFASIHKRNVVTLDPQQENFILTNNDRHPVGFIDFGRARVFGGRTLLLLVHIGKDLAKLKFDGGLSDRQYKTFDQYYKNFVTFSTLQNAVIKLSTDYWFRHQFKKNRTQSAQYPSQP